MYFFNVYLFQGEREEVQGEGQREERESEADSLLTEEPNAELNLMALRSRPEPKARVRCLTNCATQCPYKDVFLKYVYWFFFNDKNKTKKINNLDVITLGPLCEIRGTRILELGFFNAQEEI